MHPALKQELLLETCYLIFNENISCHFQSEKDIYFRILENVETKEHPQLGLCNSDVPLLTF